jgi:hypothetical protein
MVGTTVETFLILRRNVMRKSETEQPLEFNLEPDPRGEITAKEMEEIRKRSERVHARIAFNTMPEQVRLRRQ